MTTHHFPIYTVIDLLVLIPIDKNPHILDPMNDTTHATLQAPKNFHTTQSATNSQYPQILHAIATATYEHNILCCASHHRSRSHHHKLYKYIISCNIMLISLVCGVKNVNCRKLMDQPTHIYIDQPSHIIAGPSSSYHAIRASHKIGHTSFNDWWVCMSSVCVCVYGDNDDCCVVSYLVVIVYMLGVWLNTHHKVERFSLYSRNRWMMGLMH